MANLSQVSSIRKNNNTKANTIIQELCEHYRAAEQQGIFAHLYPS